MTQFPLVRFLRREDGTVSVEAIIILPILLWAYGAMFVFWDAYKTQNVNLKATYTIADLISRQADPLTPAYIDGLNDLYGFLLGPSNSSGGNDIRVSVIANRLNPVSGQEELELDWSCATGVFMKHDTVDALAPRMPIIAPNDQLIVVETRMDWTPPISIGLSPGTRSNLIYTSPRFVPQVLLSGAC